MFSEKMKLTLETIQQITFFEKLTGAKVKDCFGNDFLTFIIEEGSVQRAVRGLDRVQKAFKKEIKIIGFSSDPIKFIKNLLYPVKVENVRKEEKVVIIKCQDNRTKGKVFGREKSRLRFMLSLVKKYFDIEEIKVE